MKRNLSLLLMLIVTILACAGWAVAKPAQPSPHVLEDYRRLTLLADEVISSDNRLIVVTVRGEGSREAVQSLMTELRPYGRAVCGPTDCEYLIRYSIQSAAASQAAPEWIKEAMIEMQNNRLDGTWNINIQGNLVAEAQQTPDFVWEQIERSAKATMIESYEDAGSRSVTYQTPMLKASVRSGEHAVQLQAAAHRSTESQEWRITLGTPVILIEY
ncbi:YwmB family TATA-box binding protein [Paenibacillus thermotolerans]|uniref:YwmB family TATA-box binding protein n=1 Tax=Paenibacillus thermotolerans TaxID=3027807 RepID=UPI00236792E3|nr:MULTISPECIES: YwmB family TATA-box binding protein [unclassified Paenibacillus]